MESVVVGLIMVAVSVVVAIINVQSGILRIERQIGKCDR